MGINSDCSRQSWLMRNAASQESAGPVARTYRPAGDGGDRGHHCAPTVGVAISGGNCGEAAVFHRVFSDCVPAHPGAAEFSVLASTHRNLAYSEFKTLLKAGKLKEITLGERAVTGTFTPDGLEELLPKEKLDELKSADAGEHRLTTVRVNDPALVGELEASNVRFAGVIEDKWFSTLLSWILPAVVFVVIWGLLIKRMGGGAAGRAGPRSTVVTPSRRWRRHPRRSSAGRTRTARGSGSSP